MLDVARKLYNDFLERQKHFRPEDRAEFIVQFLNTYCGVCGGLYHVASSGTKSCFCTLQPRDSVVQSTTESWDQ